MYFKAWYYIFKREYIQEIKFDECIVNKKYLILRY